MVALATAVALVIAPIVVILTHGPSNHDRGAHAAAAESAAEVAAHGHLHSKVDGEFGGGAIAGHDATDHEHQLQSLPFQSGETDYPAAGGTQHETVASFRGLPRDGPKRPPRPV